MGRSMRPNIRQNPISLEIILKYKIRQLFAI